jgi:hypothetical protein
MFGTVLAFCLVLLPLTSDVPSTKALMARIVAGKMTVLLETLLFMSAGDEVDLLVVTHCRQDSR